MMWFFGFMTAAFCVACVVAYKIDCAHIKALREQEERRERQLRRMVRNARQWEEILEGLQRLHKDGNGK